MQKLGISRPPLRRSHGTVPLFRRDLVVTASLHQQQSLHLPNNNSSSIHDLNHVPSRLRGLERSMPCSNSVEMFRETDERRRPMMATASELPREGLREADSIERRAS